MTAFIINLLVQWLLADFLSGFWHWIEDRYFDEQWPIVGKYIAKPNQLHHDQPLEFLNQSYWNRNYTTIIPAAIAFCIYPCWTLLFVSQANEIHAWAHQKGKVNKFIAALQETGFLQSCRHHGEHHRSPFAVNYCVMTNWLNPILDGIGFWRTLEWAISPLIAVRNPS